MRSRKDRGVTAIELILIIVVAGIASAVTVPALLRGSRNAVMARCEANLKALSEAAIVTRSDPKYAGLRGAAYWEKLASDSKLKPEVLACPFSGMRYRGPSMDPSRLPPDAPLGGDAPGSHGHGEGGHVLLNSGVVRAYRERDGGWKSASGVLSP